MSGLEDKIIELEKQNKMLTKICCALHFRLAGGERVLVPNSEMNQFSGSEIISVKETDQRAVVVLVKGK